MPFDGVIFDKGGTLVDFDQTLGGAALHVLTTLARGDDELFRRLAAAGGFDPVRRVFESGSPILNETPEVCAALLARALGRRDVGRVKTRILALCRTAAVDSLQPIGRPAAMLEVLAASGLRIGVASNDQTSVVRRQLGLLGLLPHLDFVCGRDAGFGAKPGPGMIVAFAARFGLAPERVAVVGDRLEDMLAARAAGAVAVGVLTGPSLQQDIAPHADYIIESASDFPHFAASLKARSRRRRPALAHG